MALPTRFTVRVYGLWLQGGNLLVSDEFIKGKHITKLPGGGLELGEGPKDGVIREIKEELNLTVSKATHFYTTDFFIPSAFDNDSQVIVIYFKVEIENGDAFRLEDVDISHEPEIQDFRWISLSELSPDDLTLPSDKKAIELLVASL